MIRRIRISNFGSLLDVDVELGPLTLLLGPNASGKSMFIRALRTISSLLRSHPIRGHRRESGQIADFTVDHARLDDLQWSNKPGRISFSVWLEGVQGEPNYVLVIGKVSGLWSVVEEKLQYFEWIFDSNDRPLEFGTQRRGTIRWVTPGEPPRHATLPFLVYPYREDAAAEPTIKPFLKLAQDFGVAYGFRVNPADLVTPTLPRWINPDRPYVDGTGTGFIHTLQNWSQSAEGQKVMTEKVLPSLRELFPHIRRIGFQGTTAERRFLEYETDRSEKAIPAQLESDGVNLTLFLLTIPHILAKSNKGPVCLGVEEPEAGTHPLFQADRLHLLQKLATSQLTDTPIQIIATTHSPQLLRWVPREEALGVLRFVEHLGADRGTLIHQLVDQEDINRVYQEYEQNPGLAWYSGVFGATPERPPVGEY